MKTGIGGKMIARTTENQSLACILGGLLKGGKSICMYNYLFNLSRSLLALHSSRNQEGEGAGGFALSNFAALEVRGFHVVGR